MSQPPHSNNRALPAYLPASSTTPGLVPITYIPYVYKPSKRRDLEAEHLAELHKDPTERAKNAWAEAVEQGRQKAMKKLDQENFLKRMAIMYPPEGQWKFEENLVDSTELQAQGDVKRPGC